MAQKKKKPQEMTEAQKEKARQQLAKDKAKAAREREKKKAKAQKDKERYEKAAKAARERAQAAKAKEEELAKDPKYQAKKEKEAKRLKEKGKKELEKQRKVSAKKAQAAAKSKKKLEEKNESSFAGKASKGKAASKNRQSKRAAKRAAKAGFEAGGQKATSGHRTSSHPKRGKKNVIAVIIVLIIAAASAFTFWPPQDTITQGLDVKGGVSINLTASTTDGSAVTSDQMKEASSVITSRVNASGASAASVQQQGTSSFLVQVPGAEDSQSIIETLSSQGVLEFARVDSIKDDTVRGYIEQGISGMNLKDEKVKYTAFMNGDSVSQVSVARPQGSSSYAVALTLDSEGKEAFADVSSDLVSTNGQIAILLDGRVECAPSVQSAITGGEVEITGNYTSEEANDLKTIIDSGSLPVSLTIDSSSVVGPTLGQSALKVGIIAAIIGLLLVLVWLLLFYRGLGLLTGLSIIVMGIIYLGLLAVLSALGWFSLTLPGMAGVIVNIGLAADSSILILECFHEQVRSGKSIKSAAQSGVHEGIMTSLDADIVTLVSALVLYFVAIGDVRGFGLTLALGIICDLLVMALFSGPMVRIISNAQILKRPGFWGMRDDILEGKYLTEEVK